MEKGQADYFYFYLYLFCEKEDDSLHVESNRPSTHFDSLIREYILLGISLRCLGLKVNVNKHDCIKIFVILSDHYRSRRFLSLIFFYLFYYH